MTKMFYLPKVSTFRNLRNNNPFYVTPNCVSTFKISLYICTREITEKVCASLISFFILLHVIFIFNNLDYIYIIVLQFECAMIK